MEGFIENLSVNSNNKEINFIIMHKKQDNVKQRIFKKKIFTLTPNEGSTV